MYSRKSNRSTVPPHLPEHYNGWAFRPQAPSGDRPPEPQRPDRNPAPTPPKPTEPKPISFLPPPRPHEAPPPRGDPPKRNEPSPPFPPPSLAGLFSGGHLFHSSGLDPEELLLIGLIFLLGGNGEDNELPLLLALLLFCG